MQSISQTSSRKWVDYSDQSDEQQIDETNQLPPPLKTTQSMPPVYARTITQDQDIDHRSSQYIDKQKEVLREARRMNKDIWLSMQCDDQLFMDKWIRQLKEKEHREVLEIGLNKENNTIYQLKVWGVFAQEWVKQGCQQQRKIKVKVLEKNFVRGERNGDRRGGDRRDNRNGDRRGRGDRDRRGGGRGGDRGDRGDRGERRDRGDREGRGDRGERSDRGSRHGDGPRQKKQYVDKNTGKAPTNKVQTETKLFNDKERHYTKNEAEAKGLELGNFRTKSKTQTQPEPVVVEQPKKVKEVKQVKLWARKERQEEKKDQVDSPARLRYKQKKNSIEGGQNAEKKNYVQKRAPADLTTEVRNQGMLDEDN